MPPPHTYTHKHTKSRYNQTHFTFKDVTLGGHVSALCYRQIRHTDANLIAKLKAQNRVYTTAICTLNHKQIKDRYFLTGKLRADMINISLSLRLLYKSLFILGDSSLTTIDCLSVYVCEFAQIVQAWQIICTSQYRTPLYHITACSNNEWWCRSPHLRSTLWPALRDVHSLYWTNKGRPT